MILDRESIPIYQPSFFQSKLIFILLLRGHIFTCKIRFRVLCSSFKRRVYSITISEKLKSNSIILKTDDYKIIQLHYWTCLDTWPFSNWWLPSHNGMDNNCIFLQDKNIFGYIWTDTCVYIRSWFGLCIEFHTLISTSSKMMQLISLTPAPIRTLAEIETLGPICIKKCPNGQFRRNMWKREIQKSVYVHNQYFHFSFSKTLRD